MRDRIAEIIVPHLENEDTDYGDCYQDAVGIADRILALLPTLTVEEECTECDGGYITYNPNLNPNAFPATESVKCRHCDTGTITRPISWDELAETMRELFDCYCNGCEFLIPTEQEQDRMTRKEPHWCKKYHKKVYHYDQHPFILRESWCKEKPLPSMKELDGK